LRHCLNDSYQAPYALRKKETLTELFVP